VGRKITSFTKKSCCFSICIYYPEPGCRGGQESTSRLFVPVLTFVFLNRDERGGQENNQYYKKSLVVSVFAFIILNLNGGVGRKALLVYLFQYLHLSS
jgi:hypothetical protein